MQNMIIFYNNLKIYRITKVAFCLLSSFGRLVSLVKNAKKYLPVIARADDDL